MLHLQPLRRELDVDQPAASELEIVARATERGALTRQLPLHAHPQMMDALRRRRASLVCGGVGDREHPLPERAIPGARARLEERLTLPVLRRLLAADAVVTPERVHRHDEEPLVAGGAEARVELVARPVAVRRAHQAHHALRGANEALRGVDVGPRRVVVDEEDVEIGSVADLSPPQLAHGDHREAALVHPPLVQREARGVVERRVGQRRERERAPARAQLPGQIGEPHLHRDAALGAAERPHEVLAVGISGKRGDLLVDRAPRALLGGRAAAEQEAVEQLGVTGQRLAEERARAKEARDPARGARVLRERLGVDAGGRQAREEGGHEARRLLRIGRVGERLHQHRGELRKLVTRAGAQREVGAPRQGEEVPRQVG